jgi:predicted enzyme related to lactoylglutathione lyase
MKPRWITAFVDQPAALVEAGTRFWASVTESTVSPRRGDRDEFARLLPSAGDVFLRAQAIADGRARLHVDFHVDSISAAVEEARALGAKVQHDFGHVVMSSPGGLIFCFVDDEGERDIPPPVGSPASALDQICLDIPGLRFDEEVAFWRGLFGWADRQVPRAEFHRLAEPAGLPFQLLFQRLGADSAATSVSAHFDIAAGEDREAIATQHVALGATRLATFDRWIVMQDPAGLEYCVTGRAPGATPT